MGFAKSCEIWLIWSEIEMGFEIGELKLRKKENAIGMIWFDFDFLKGLVE